MKNNNTACNKTSIITLIILTFIVGIASYLHSLNGYIKATFNKIDTSQTLIFTDIIKIPSNSLISKAKLKYFLNNLNYIPTNKIPQNEGEYYEIGHKIYIYRNHIRTKTSNLKKKLYIIDYKENKLLCPYSKKCDKLILDSMPIESNKNVKNKVQFLPLKSFNKALIDILLFVEDKRFFSHHGIDLGGIARAAAVNIKSKKIKQGASTISQQLVKNLFLTREKSFKRKFKEIILSLYVEFLYSKEEILEKYLNTVYLGQDKNTAILGFVSASKFFFNKNINDLSLSEISMLVGLIKAPTTYSPILNYKKSNDRKNLILKLLYEDNIISKTEYEKNKIKKIKLNIRDDNETRDNYFFDAVISSIKKESSSSISQIYTGLNPLFQECAVEAIKNGIKEIEDKAKNLKNIESAIVTVNSKTGLISSYIAGKDYKKSEYDRIRLAKRQVGSVIKPFVYLVGLDPSLNNYKVATPISILMDRPIIFKDPLGRSWAPKNYDKKFRGPVTLREALEKSLNVPTVYLAKKVTIKKIVNLLKELGMKFKYEESPAICLGTVDLSLLEITSAYTLFSNLGEYVSPRFYETYFDKTKNEVIETKTQEKILTHEGSTFILNSILEGVFTNGTAKSAKEHGFNLTFAGKTGTSSNKRDNWFIGYNPEYVTGVWVGTDDNKEMPFSGAQTALPIWTKYTSCISKYIEDKKFTIPDTVEKRHLSKSTFEECNLNVENETNCFYDYFLTDEAMKNKEKPSKEKTPTLTPTKSLNNKKLKIKPTNTPANKKAIKETKKIEILKGALVAIPTPMKIVYPAQSPTIKIKQENDLTRKNKNENNLSKKRHERRSFFDIVN